jgi:hypothetical protein
MLEVNNQIISDEIVSEVLSIKEFASIVQSKVDRFYGKLNDGTEMKSTVSNIALQLIEVKDSIRGLMLLILQGS